ncbi:hypothetical protein DERP_012074, partial [Dermatophagoides pteronyssinus]
LSGYKSRARMHPKCLFRPCESFSIEVFKLANHDHYRLPYRQRYRHHHY